MWWREGLKPWGKTEVFELENSCNPTGAGKEEVNEELFVMALVLVLGLGVGLGVLVVSIGEEGIEEGGVVDKPLCMGEEGRLDSSDVEELPARVFVKVDVTRNVP